MHRDDFCLPAEPQHMYLCATCLDAPCALLTSAGLCEFHWKMGGTGLDMACAPAAGQDGACSAFQSQAHLLQAAGHCQALVQHCAAGRHAALLCMQQRHWPEACHGCMSIELVVQEPRMQGSCRAKCMLRQLEASNLKGTWLDYKRNCGRQLHAELQLHRLSGADLACWCCQKAATCTMADPVSTRLQPCVRSRSVGTWSYP